MYLDGGKHSHDPTKSSLEADSRHKPWHMNGASKKLQLHGGKLAWEMQDVRKTPQYLLISFWGIGVASKCKPAGGPPPRQVGAPPRPVIWPAGIVEPLRSAFALCRDASIADQAWCLFVSFVW